MSHSLHVLIVEDEPTIASLLEKMIMQLGQHKVWKCTKAACAFEVTKNEQIDLIFMDLNIDGSIDGIQCAKEITMKHQLFIAFATSYSDPQTLEEAIDVNTLNYLVKPYSKKDIEITLNLASAHKKKLVQHNKHIEDKPSYTIYGYTIDVLARQVRNQSQVFKLSKKEFDLLVLLAKYSPLPVENRLIIKSVWDNRNIAASTLRETITRIRKKLPDMTIESIHGIGYQIK